MCIFWVHDNSSSVNSNSDISNSDNSNSYGKKNVSTVSYNHKLFNRTYCYILFFVFQLFLSYHPLIFFIKTVYKQFENNNYNMNSIFFIQLTCVFCIKRLTQFNE